MTPAKIEVATTLDSLEPAKWDALAHGFRPWDKLNHSNTLASFPDSISKVQLRPELDSTSQMQTTPAPADRQGNGGGMQPDSTCEGLDSFSQEDEANPFISHAFLSALENSGSTGERSGWSPLFLLAKTDCDELCGALPIYAKAHSRGEYVFDHAFADAYHRHDLAYYPKLQISVPFTPARARKLLVSPHSDEAATRRALLGGLETLRGRLEASSIHATFLTRADQDSFAGAGYLLREDRQFHFFNRGYRDYADFLDALASRKRKALKKERREALEAGIEVEWLTGSALTEAHWDAFFTFYQDTGSRKWGSPYLTRAFFSLIGERMADKILLIMARRNGRYIAGALNFIGANTLYGRNWGCLEHHPCLHFELCYHQAIDFALQKGLSRVEAGAQGEHKIARGYEPVATFSAHRFADPRFHAAIADYLERERAAVREMGAELAELAPFRRGEIAQG